MISNENFQISKCVKRLFEACKPFYIRQTRTNDRVTCGLRCGYQLEMKYNFKAYVTYRKTHVSNSKLKDSMYEMVNKTICPANNEL